MQRQETQVEGDMNNSKENSIAGGGIDGGFSHEELNEILN